MSRKKTVFVKLREGFTGEVEVGEEESIIPVESSSPGVVSTFDAIIVVLRVLGQIRVWHWCTSNDHVHSVLDDLIDELAEVGDELVELVVPDGGEFPGATITYAGYVDAQDCAESLKGVSEMLLGLGEGVRADILSVRDRFVGEINKAVYLLGMDEQGA